MKINTNRLYIIAFFISLMFFFFSAELLEKKIGIVIIEENKYQKIKNIKAKSAIIYDIKEEITLAGKNIYQTRPIASITKLITASIATNYINDQDEIKITNEDFLIEASTNIAKNKVWAGKDLLKYSLITSSNRGFNAIERTVEEKTKEMFTDLIKQFIDKNNLSQTYALNTTGLDNRINISGSSSSVLDIVKIAKLFLNNFFEIANSSSQAKKTFYTTDGEESIANNTNILLKKDNNNYKILLSKTGYTDIAGGCLIMIVQFTNKNPVALVILGSTKAGRFKDMEHLLEIARNI